MLKTIGIILVSCAISLYGAHLSGKMRRDAQRREGLYELLAHIKTCIDNGAPPLQDIFSSFRNEPLRACGFLETLQSGEPGAFPAALQHPELHLPPETARLYEAFAESLGKSGFRQTESELVARYMALIRPEEEKCKKAEEVRRVLYRKLGLLCGLLAALIFI